ncbi:MAG TPA: ribosome maturation factor RimP [Burkholderiaceae bacterium]|nr:ribosome maturation factor RimP [Burkholderiaceae bacterium]
MAGVTSDLYQMVQRTVGGLGYELVDVERLGGGLLRVTLDAAQGIGLEDCERVSRQLSHLFAVEGVEYERLEVSSPGLDRPLKAVKDFARFVGKEINVQLHAPLAAAGGRKRLRGRLLALVGGAGAERLQLQLTPEDAAAKGGRGSGKRGPENVAPAIVIEIALRDVDKARLVPELNFRPARAGDKVKFTAVGTSGAGSLGSEFR